MKKYFRGDEDNKSHETFTVCVSNEVKSHFWASEEYLRKYWGAKTGSKPENSSLTFVTLKVWSNSKCMYSFDVDSFHCHSKTHTWAHGPWTISFWGPYKVSLSYWAQYNTGPVNRLVDDSRQKNLISISRLIGLQFFVECAARAAHSGYLYTSLTLFPSQ